MRKLGFTLAEVLITLVVIGVIAATTIPTLINNTNAHEYKSALKKAVSGVNQALGLHYANEGEGLRPVGGPSAGYSDYSYFETALLKYVKGKPIDFFPGDNTYCTDGGGGQLIDGSIFCIDITNWDVNANDSETTACNSANTTPCAIDFNKPNMLIDVNGEKGPNKMTTDPKAPKDQYQAMLYNNKLVPFGEAAQKIFYEKNSNN